MKRIFFIFVKTAALFILFAGSISPILLAQSWTSIDGGGTTGINDYTSSVNADMPSCAVYNGELYAIWQESNQVHIKKYNKNTLAWNNAGDPATGSKLNASSFTASSPKLVTYNGYLYAAWNEGDVVSGDPAMLGVHVKRFNGSTWEFVQDYSTGEGRVDINKYANLCGEHVDLVVYNGELYAAWQEFYTGTTRLQLRVSKFNGSLWSRVDGGGDIGLNCDYNNNLSMYAPSLCVYNNKLYVSWLEAIGGVSQLFVKRYDGGSTWTLVGGSGGVGLNYSSTTIAYTPNLTSDNNKLYLFWKESNKVRVKQYDGTNWTTDPDGGSGWKHNGSGSYNPFGFRFVNLNYIAWEENYSAVRQIRVVSFDGTTKTYIDGDGTNGINQNTAMNVHNPKLTENNGDLYAVWNEDNNGDDNHNQIRAKKYPLPPVVKSVNVPANGTYIIGQALNFTVNFSKNVVVSGGTPYIPITLNTGGTVNATYTSGTGTSTLTFRYTIVAGNADPDGISVGTAISNGGATLQSEDATPLTANLTLNSVGSTSAVLVSEIAPTTQTSAVMLNSNAAGTTLTISWTNGNGANRAVFMKETAGAITNPSDGTTYTASADWTSKGTQLGTSGYYCIYNGTGTSVSVTGTTPNTYYVAQAFEYNGTGSGTLYNNSTATGNPSNTTSLPVELTTFAATVVNNAAMLAWNTATEVNNYGFEVERRIVDNQNLSLPAPNRGGLGWGSIGFVAGNGTSNTEHIYSYADANVSSGTYAYRLKQIDNSGTFKYSSETEVTISIPKVLTLANYPNPFNPSTVISYSLPVTGSVSLKVYDVVGREVATLVNETKNAGSYTVIFEASKLSSGVYFSRLENNGSAQIKKLVLMK
jgi:hypothetical protein